MTTWKANLETDLIQELTLQDESGTAFDLTNRTVTCKMRERPEGPVIATATVTVDVAASGQVTVQFTDTDIDTAGEGVFYADVLITDDVTGDKYRTERVRIKIDHRVT